MGSTKFEDDLQYLVNEGIVYNTVDGMFINLRILIGVLLDDHFATM